MFCIIFVALIDIYHVSKATNSNLISLCKTSIFLGLVMIWSLLLQYVHFWLRPKLDHTNVTFVFYVLTDIFFLFIVEVSLRQEKLTWICLIVMLLFILLLWGVPWACCYKTNISCSAKPAAFKGKYFRYQTRLGDVSRNLFLRMFLGYYWCLQKEDKRLARICCKAALILITQEAQM